MTHLEKTLSIIIFINALLNIYVFINLYHPSWLKPKKNKNINISKISRVSRSPYLEMIRENLFHELYVSIAKELDTNWFEVKKECMGLCGDEEDLYLTRMINAYTKKHKALPKDLTEIGIIGMFAPMNTRDLTTNCFYYYDFKKEISDFPRPFCLIHQDRKNCINCPDLAETS